MKTIIGLILFLSVIFFTVGFINHSSSELVLGGLFIGAAIWYGVSEWKARVPTEYRLKRE